jgi:hypothetical protein
LLSTAVVGVFTVSLSSPQILAQSVRVSGNTTIQYVEMLPLVVDSVDATLVSGRAPFTRAPDGQLVRCIADQAYCRFSRSGNRVYTAPAIQDLSVSVWGIGRGIRGYARLRGRAVLGGEDPLWPQSDDPYDLLMAYAEINRGLVRFRAGRQFKTSGLGYYNFDGASALVQRGALAMEAYGGWSLARGLNEPRASESLEAIESFAPEARAVLVGGQLSYRPTASTAVTALYQREIRDDRLGLYSERVAVDATARRGRMSVEGTVEADVALGLLNEARLRASVTPRSDLGLGVFARRYRPFFELWTIWGAFDPVGFDEYGGNVRWRIPGRTSTLELRAGRRTYDDHNAGTAFGEIRTTGWNFRISGSTRPASSWLLLGGYGTDVGFGAASVDANVQLRREVGDDHHVGLGIRAYQRLYEFRVREGTVFGVGGNAGVRLGPRTRFAGSLTVYRHLSEQVTDVDWSQVRGTLRVDWTVGAEPASPIGRQAGR